MPSACALWAWSMRAIVVSSLTERIRRLLGDGERRRRKTDLARDVVVDEVGSLLDVRAAQIPERDLARELHSLRRPIDRPANLGGECALRVLTRDENDSFDRPR